MAIRLLPKAPDGRKNSRRMATSPASRPGAGSSRRLGSSRTQRLRDWCTDDHCHPGAYAEGAADRSAPRPGTTLHGAGALLINPAAGMIARLENAFQNRAMMIDPSLPEDERKRWRVERLDSCADHPGEVLSADDQTGEVRMRDQGGEETSYSLGQDAIRLIRR